MPVSALAIQPQWLGTNWIDPHYTQLRAVGCGFYVALRAMVNFGIGLDGFLGARVLRLIAHSATCGCPRTGGFLFARPGHASGVTGS